MVPFLFVRYFTWTRWIAMPDEDILIVTNASGVLMAVRASPSFIVHEKRTVAPLLEGI